MTTETALKKRTYPPKKLVPVGEWIVVRVAQPPTQAKPFTKQVKDKKTGELVDKVIAQVFFHVEIADKEHPHLCGQHHLMKMTDTLTPSNEKAEASKLYATITNMAGYERAAEVQYKYVFDSKSPEKLIPKEFWESIYGFYAAKFSEPDTNEDKTVKLDENGGIAWQTVKEIGNLPGLRWKEEDVVLWPPPLGLPKPAPRTQPAPPPQETPAPEPEPVPDPTPAPAQQAPMKPLQETPAQPAEPESPKVTPESPIAEVDRWIQDNRQPHLSLIKAFIFVDRKVDRVGALKEDDRRHLMRMMLINAHLQQHDEERRQTATDLMNAMTVPSGLSAWRSLEPKNIELLYYRMEIAARLASRDHNRLATAQDLTSGMVDTRGVTSWEDMTLSDLKLLVVTIDNALNSDVPF